VKAGRGIANGGENIIRLALSVGARAAVAKTAFVGVEPITGM